MDGSSQNQIAAYTDRMVERIRNVICGDLLGVYLHGSLVLGDFDDARSDIDAIAVATRSLSPEEKREIADGLSQKALPCAASGLEFHALAQNALTAQETPPFELHVATSSRGRSNRVVDGQGTDGDPDLVMHFAVLHRHGRTLIGPPAREVFPPVPRRLLLPALVRELDWARRHAPPSYQVLNACRAWRFADEDVHCSKTQGGEWARARASYPAVIDAALRLRAGLEAQIDSAPADALLTEVETRLRDAIRAEDRGP